MCMCAGIYIYIYIYVCVCVCIYKYIYICICRVCNMLIGQSYTFKDSKKTFIINKKLSCNSKKVIYIIECENCKQTYIGCTKKI